jgi:TPR repeat protein
MMRTKVAVYLLLSLLLVTGLCAQPSKRIALIIGVQNYSKVSPLRHSLSDATDMSAALKAKGFTVETLLDPKTKTEIKNAITRYYNTMQGQSGAVGIIYYAGHGTQNEGENYLIPATANLQVPGDLDDQCVKMNVVKGLASVEAPKGSIVVFATQPGTVASDGEGKNGLFTSKLLKYIDEPNLNVIDVFRKVKVDVNSESGGRQLPSVVDNSLGGDFYFTKQQSPNLPPVAQPSNKKVDDAPEIYLRASQLDAKSEIKAALELATPLAQQGNSGAQCFLGQCYMYGYGVDRNYQEANNWFRKSSEQGFAYGQSYLGSMYLHGYGLRRDNIEALRLIRLAIDQGDGFGMFLLGQAFKYGWGVEPDNEEADKWQRKSMEAYLKRAEMGDLFAQAVVGRRYQTGQGVLKNQQEAISWFNKAADQGCSDAFLVLGMAYKNGDGVEKNMDQANLWFRKSLASNLKKADEGSEPALIAIATIYERGNGVEKDPATAQIWYRKAFEKDLKGAELGEESDMARIAGMYYNGNGVEENKTKAFEWRLKAAESGDENSEAPLAEMYRDGVGVGTNYDEALKWFLVANQHTPTRWTEEIGALYSKKEWKNNDYQKGLQWFLKNSDRSNNSKDWIGTFYRDGHGVSQDYLAAIKWFQKAADNGYARSQANLGQMYEDGLGVSKDQKLAIDLYKKAAAQNDQWAKDRLKALGF